jgi:hypothetical protein
MRSATLACALLAALAAAPDSVPLAQGKPLIRFVSVGAFKITLEKTTPGRVRDILGPGKTSKADGKSLIAYRSADARDPAYIVLESEDGGRTITGVELSRSAPFDSTLVGPPCRAHANEIVFDQGLALGTPPSAAVARLGSPQAQRGESLRYARQRSWQQPAAMGDTRMVTWTETYRVDLKFDGERLVAVRARKRTTS